MASTTNPRIAIQVLMCMAFGFGWGCTGTESGNPPFAAHELIHVESMGDQIRIIGAPGSIDPAFSLVEVFNLDEDTPAFSFESNLDGSFSEQMSGMAIDRLRLVAMRGRLRSNVVPLQVEASLPAPTDCVVFEQTAVDIEREMAASTRLLNGCDVSAEVSAPSMRVGHVPLRVTPANAFVLAPGESRTITLESMSELTIVEQDLAEYIVTVSTQTDTRAISAFMR